ncbi:MAG: FliA/WhiG family RNA polymerase sigma factor [Bacillota bacterium]
MREIGKEVELNKCWHRFKQSGDPQAKETLILAYAPLVKYVVGRVAIGLPTYVDADDLFSYGIFGLLDAIERFEVERGIKFETYALTRIRGSIWDGVRLADWVPRSVRQKARDLERTFHSLEQRLGRAATDAEMAHMLGLTDHEYGALLTEVSGATMLSLDETLRTDGESQIRLGETLVDHAAPSPDAEVLMADEQQELAEAILHLPERERLVLTLYYYEGLTLKEIGAVLDVSESRVCQLHTKAIARLRAKMNALS